MDFVTGEILAIDKPKGWTSFDVVKRLRGAIQRRLGVKRFKVGHAGTLDPLATGVLMVCTGRGTKEIDTLQAGDKEYVATLRLGATTPSFDLETEIDSEHPCDHITQADIETVLHQFRGDIMQVPPIYSAVKIDGRRAYKFARKGHEVTLQAKPVRIGSIEITECRMPLLTIRVSCSKGTYIRALARDIGEALGCGAHLTDLRRTRIGSHDIGECMSVDDALKLINSTTLELPEWWTQSHPQSETTDN